MARFEDRVNPLSTAGSWYMTHYRPPTWIGAELGPSVRDRRGNRAESLSVLTAIPAHAVFP